MVLLIDEDKSIRTLISAVLRRDDLTVDVATGADQAIDKLRGGAYSAVLLDVRDSGGLEVLRFLKAEQPRMLRRVVVITTASKQALECLAERDLVWETVRKPFEIGYLVDVVRSCRAQRPRTATPARSDAGTTRLKARAGSR